MNGREAPRNSLPSVRSTSTDASRHLSATWLTSAGNLALRLDLPHQEGRAVDRQENDFSYSTRRAREEALRSILAHSDVAASAHWQLSVLHRARALEASGGGAS
jgi:hypothetical protein